LLVREPNQTTALRIGRHTRMWSKAQA